MKRWIHAAKYTSPRSKLDESDSGFNEYQLHEIEQGRKSRVDFNLYARPEFDWRQMLQIREGLEQGLDVSLYADPEFNWEQMDEIRTGLDYGIDVNLYADTKFDSKQMKEIRIGLINGTDASKYANPKLNWHHMQSIRKGLEKYRNDPAVNKLDPALIAEAYNNRWPSLQYATSNDSERAKLDWSRVKEEVSQPDSDITEIEDKYQLGSLEGRAVHSLGLSSELNSDDSITFFNLRGMEVGTISATDYDTLVRNAINRSSRRSSFAGAFATQLKRKLDL